MESTENQELQNIKRTDSFRYIHQLIGKLNYPVSLTWEHVAIIFISVAAILTRFTKLGERVMSHDESLHVFYSWQLSIGNGFVHTPMMHGPLLFESTALMNLLFGANDFTSRLIPALLGTFIAIVIPQMLKPWIGRIGAMAGSFLFLISPYMLYYSRYIRHDTLVIAWMLLVVFAIFAYLKDRKERYLVLLVAPLALMFSTMEITFIYLAIFASFLFTRMLWINGLHWKTIKASPEFDILILMVTMGGFFSSAIALPIINPIFLRLTKTPFVDISILGSQGSEWISGPTAIRLISLFGLFAIASSVIGFLWGRSRWLKLAGLFLGISILTFTTFFTNPSGLASGFIGSLGYWLSQQGVARGGQPWYYFFIVFPIYEYLPIIGGIGAAVFFSIQRKHLSELAKVFIPFLFWWAIGIFLALSFAGEKMPWLSTHLAVPSIFLTAWWIGQMLEGNWRINSTHIKRDEWFNRIGSVGIGILVLLTMRTSFFVNYVNYDFSTEYIDYAHGAPGVKWVVNDLQAIANHTGAGKALKIAFDDEVSWPMSWYLKDYSNRVYFGAEPSRETLNAPVVIAGPKNWKKVELILGSNYHRFEVIRLWWPIEDYKNLTWERIWNAAKNSEMRRALWNILWNRDYTRYANLTGETIDPPTTWPLAEKMRVYVRKDIAHQILSLSMGTTMLEDIPQQVDAYADIKRTINPDLVISAGELNSPRNIAIGKDGSIYVADSGNSRIVKYNAKGEFETTWGSRTIDGQTPPAPGSFAEPWGIATDNDGNILVADTWNHRIQKFDSNGNFLIQWGLPGEAKDGLDRLWGPRGVVVSPDGKVFVTDTGNKRVVVFTSEGKPLYEFENEGSAKLDEPVGIAISSDGKVFIADTWNFRVAVFSQEGKFFYAFPIQAWSSDSIDNKPFLAMGKDNLIYVSDPENSRIMVFSQDGKPIYTFGEPGVEENNLYLPIGIAIGSDHTLWVADAGNNQLKRFEIDLLSVP